MSFFEGLGGNRPDAALVATQWMNENRRGICIVPFRLTVGEVIPCFLFVDPVLPLPLVEVPIPVRTLAVISILSRPLHPCHSLVSAVRLAHGINVKPIAPVFREEEKFFKVNSES